MPALGRMMPGLVTDRTNHRLGCRRAILLNVPFATTSITFQIVVRVFVRLFTTASALVRTFTARNTCSVSHLPTLSTFDFGFLELWLVCLILSLSGCKMKFRA